jgi:hypothetical protein
MDSAPRSPCRVAVGVRSSSSAFSDSTSTFATLA